MQKRSIGVLGILAVFLFLVVPVSFAHEFVVNQATMAPHAGQVFLLSVVSAHIFMVSEGWKQTGRKGLKNVISSGKHEKFCKNPDQCGYTG